nr:interferon regulatory factor 3 isoform X2 [Camelus bactrianus]XP_045366668.1 interferon regulatory factor 3 isoform X2 [Camelus bactrianus]XP_045366669.1 interferon regulatory factor 3 isoform X2 [Camelus bactrianus]XP_045366670.1 interferon regulatory factor 3 isoform X2 [Camelus bactrianus]
MGTQKPRILPWLVSQLDHGQLEGVAWLDESRTRFRIPWKHGLRQDAQQEDFGIFQAWAEASGAYTPGKDKPDLPTWKRNFRSALNRKEVLRLADDRSKDPHDPHKIYEFVTSGIGDFVEPDTCLDTNSRSSTSDTQEDSLEKLLSSVDLAPDGGPSGLTVAPAHPPQLLLSPNFDIPAPCPNSGLLENPLKHLLVSEEDWEFEVTAFYRGCQVFQQTIFCQGGLRLVGSETGDRTLPGQPIRLPDPAVSLTDRGVIDYVRRVLSCLGGGLALGRAGQWLWAQRLGHCHVYWAVGEELLPDSGHKPDGEVPKDTEGGVFNLGPFIAGSWAPRSDCLHRRKQALTTLHPLVLCGAVVAPGPIMDQETCNGQGCAHVPQGPARYGTGRGCLLPGEHCGPAHFQQPPALPHLRPVQGLPPGPGGGHGHGLLGHWGGLSPCPLHQPINWFLPWSSRVSGVQCPWASPDSCKGVTP